MFSLFEKNGERKAVTVKKNSKLCLDVPQSVIQLFGETKQNGRVLLVMLFLTSSSRCLKNSIHSLKKLTRHAILILEFNSRRGCFIISVGNCASILESLSILPLFYTYLLYLYCYIDSPWQRTGILLVDL